MFRYVGMFALVLAIGCGEPTLDSVLKSSGVTTQEILPDVAECYQGLRVHAENYQLEFDRACIDELIAGGISEQPSARGLSVSEVIRDKHLYQHQEVVVQGYVIWISESGLSFALSDEPSIRHLAAKYGDADTALRNSLVILQEDVDPFVLELERKYRLSLLVNLLDGKAVGVLRGTPVLSP